SSSIRYQLYHSDPSGNYSGWKATCIGANTANATALLENCPSKEAISLAVKVFAKTMDSASIYRAYTAKEIEKLLADEDVKKLLEEKEKDS
ncbi:hypothetical protein HK100_005143, partial [Physocladia obscura]